MDHSEHRRATRRHVLQAGAAALTGLVGRAASAAASLTPILKKIPSTGERLPVIGLGAIWFRDAQFDDLSQVVGRMVALGGRLIDTAAAYGESEGVIGRALAAQNLRSKVFLASKFDSGAAGPPPSAPAGAAGAAPPPLPGPPPGVERPGRDGVGGEASFERSLQRLQTDHLDLLQVHGMNGTEQLMPLLLDWKQRKRIRYIGVTTSNIGQHDELVETMRRYPLDFVQVDYSIGNREAAARVLPVALERKVAVLANLPLGRATLLQQVAQKPLPAWVADFDVSSWGQFLLKYVVSHPAVTCAIPGMTHVNHVEDNEAAGRGRLPNAAQRMRMEKLWESLA